MYYYTHLEYYIKSFYTKMNIHNPVDLQLRRISEQLDIMIYEIYGHVLKELEEESVLLFSQSLQSIGANNGAN